MENLNKMLEKAVDSLEDVIRGITRKDNMSPAELEHLSKSICIIERIKNIQREEGGEEYSENSYRRGRSRTTGRYVSRDGNSNRDYSEGNSSRSYENSNRHYDSGNSRGYYDSSGYSGHSIKDRMISRLEEMYDEAQNDHERQVVDEWINRLSSR